MTAVDDDPDNPTHRFIGVVADRAFTNRTFIGFNTNEGIASVAPERLFPGGRDLDEPARPQRHVGRAQGPLSLLRRPVRGGGRARRGAPPSAAPATRAWAYRCALRWTEDCRNEIQTISCRREVRALLPIGRRERVFHDLLQSHSQFEGVFDAWRDRYAVSGTSNATRSKRRVSIEACSG